MHDKETFLKAVVQMCSFCHFFDTDNDMQGTEGTLCGPDVRRRIPIKLLPKQARNKPAPRPQRPAGRLPSKTHSVDEGI